MTVKELIREMNMDDLDEVMEIENSCFASPWSIFAFEHDLLHNSHAKYFVLLNNGQIAGYTGIWMFENVGHIVNMAVKKEFRRRGYASRLLHHLIRFAHENGVERFTLEVRASNTAAVNLYKASGFVDVGIRPRYYQDNREDAVIMWTRCEDGEIRFD